MGNGKRQLAVSDKTLDHTAIRSGQEIVVWIFITFDSNLGI